ncbi:MAG: cellulase family glycosylhydrolase [Muribaculaceae bacterium]|nr:cellulase family glycosylhydrolase [Muribaculaceae bacterium]
MNLLCAALLAIGCAACGDDKNEPAPVWGDGITVKSEVALAGATPQTLNIKASTTPSVTTDAAWLHIGEVKAGAAGIYSVELSADANTTAEARTADVSITAGQDKATVKVTQMPGDAVQISAVEPSAELDPLGGTIVVKYLSTAEPTVSLPAWMKKVEGRAFSEGTLTLSYSRNVSVPREGEIVLSLGNSVSASVTVSQQVAPVQEINGLTAMELASMMYAGINIGNTMECPGSEGAWSMPVNEQYVAALAEMGFNAVRIPCAWDSHATDGVIDPAWLARVDEVVGWVIGHDMFAILNIHWDGGWLENNLKNGWNADIDKKQHDYWTQIANQLNHYDEHLLLAAMNEPDGPGQVGTEAIMKYQKTMLDAVRSTGGYNATRVLVMQVPCTNIDEGCKGIYQMPEDVIADRLMVEAHFYDPYQFNMMQEDADWGKTWWYWGEENFVAGSDRNANHSAADIRTQMQKMKTHFVDKGYPAIIGEYCVCEDRSSQKGVDKEKHQASLRDWNQVVTREAKNAGCVPFFWETGGDINRRDGSVRRSYQLDGLFAGAAEGHYPF